jgi:hypothetical protein
MKIQWSVHMTAFNNAKASGQFEIDDSATDEEIDVAVRDEISNHVEWGWQRADGIGEDKT